MFRRRLSLVLILLAAIIALQGAAAVLALREVERQVARGRMANDIHLGFLQLSTTKQRLRSWLTQHMVGAGGDPAERDVLLNSLHITLADLYRLTRAAAQVGPGAHGGEEHRARPEALRILDQHVRGISDSVRDMAALPADASARQAWSQLADVFEISQGQDLRQLIALNIARETAVVQRERGAADQALARMRWLWIGMALSLAMVALSATVYFGPALRRPLDALFKGAQALRQGRLDHRIVWSGPDEFSDVARSMNAMAEELEQHRQRESEQRHLLEAQVRQRTRDLHEANESLHQTDVRRRQLLADVSHELRTPTTALRGEAEITLRGPDRSVAEYREALRRIVDTSAQLSVVIDDLLAMARSDMDTLSLVRKPLDLSLPLMDALTQARALARLTQVRIECVPLPALTWWVLGDAQRLCQLVLLLLNNAVCYSQPQGSVWVQLQASEDGCALDLCIIDEGIGIAPHELPFVFERHFRGAEARRHRAAGSGLGLPIAQALAQAHAGSLQLSSPAHPGGTCGTRALLRLPLLPRQGELL
jgi:two-component system, OmpR family, sensor kinase